MGQAPGFDQEALLRLPSEESLVSLDATGFAQIHQEDLRFFPSSEGSASASSSDAFSPRPASTGSLDEFRPLFLPHALRPQFMYRAGLYGQLASGGESFRSADSGQSLNDALFGTQPCSLLLLCLDSRDWRVLLLCSRACHDNIAVQARATAMDLPFQA